MSYLVLSNDSAKIFASSAVVDPDNSQLVAAMIPFANGGNHPELVKAILAGLVVNNNNRWTRIGGSDLPQSYLAYSARRRYTITGSKMHQAHAEGSVQCWLHPLAGNPQEQTSDFFYIVFFKGEDAGQKFVNRLNLAAPWPVQVAWADIVYNAAQEAGLVHPLACFGSAFPSAVRVAKDEAQWQALLTQCLSRKEISL